jgi:hypothetical protein
MYTVYIIYIWFWPTLHMLRREAWLGGRALLADPSTFLLADLSLFFPSSQCHSHCHSQNPLQTTRSCIQNFIGSPVIAGSVAPAISGRPGPALGCPSGTAQILLFIPVPGRDVQPWSSQLLRKRSHVGTGYRKTPPPHNCAKQRSSCQKSIHSAYAHIHVPREHISNRTLFHASLNFNPKD